MPKTSVDYFNIIALLNDATRRFIVTMILTKGVEEKLPQRTALLLVPSLKKKSLFFCK